MAILFAGGEFEAFDAHGAFGDEGKFSFDTATTAAYDGTYSRGAMKINRSRFLRAEFTASLEGWLHFKFYSNVIDHADTDNWIVRLFDKSGTKWGVGLDANGDGASQQLHFRYRTGAGAYVDQHTFTTGTDLLDATLYTIDIHWKIDNTVGIYELYLDGSFVDSFEGDTLDAGDVDTIDAVEFSNPSHDAAHFIHFSEVIVADESTVGWHLATLGATADSATNNAWTNGEAEIDDVGTHEDLTLIRSDTTDQIQGFVVDDAPVPGEDIVGVIVSARGLVGKSAVQNIQAHTRVSGTDYFTGNLTAEDINLRPIQGIFDDNPDTAVAWTESEVNAAEFGLRSKT